MVCVNFLGCLFSGTPVGEPILSEPPPPPILTPEHDGHRHMQHSVQALGTDLVLNSQLLLCPASFLTDEMLAYSIREKFNCPEGEAGTGLPDCVRVCKRVQQCSSPSKSLPFTPFIV